MAREATVLRLHECNVYLCLNERQRIHFSARNQTPGCYDFSSPSARSSVQARDPSKRHCFYHYLNCPHRPAGPILSVYKFGCFTHDLQSCHSSIQQRCIFRAYCIPNLPRVRDRLRPEEVRYAALILTLSSMASVPLLVLFRVAQL